MDLSLFSLLPDSINLVIAPHAAITLIHELTARLALAGSVRVLDCGNRYDIYPVAKVLRRLGSEVDWPLEQIHLSRAFTCHQVVAMLVRETAHEPVIIIDLLATFLDEDVCISESRRLLDNAIGELKRLSQAAPVLATTRHLPMISVERQVLLEDLRQVAAVTWEPETPAAVLSRDIQPMLWMADQEK